MHHSGTTVSLSRAVVCSYPYRLFVSIVWPRQSEVCEYRHVNVIQRRISARDGARECCCTRLSAATCSPRWYCSSIPPYCTRRRGWSFCASISVTEAVSRRRRRRPVVVTSPSSIPHLICLPRRISSRVRLRSLRYDARMSVLSLCNLINFCCVWYPFRSGRELWEHDVRI